ncbi:SIN3-HDAC complex-associated factor [Polistes fuscatus]|uniref:SIN3-HDAC complex-associated factor n=1 Tax=Polistes fuscatus TaxID=30207 RepID=UPI001CA9A19C|nr:SIN3-HDAC complex-associated factor [Polistes fuscatus]XP_043491365.1 SIN3-HDAC complex-associated factor [Polistes fuscatus]XP_043491376.1 SIN3-HDAC complex-associated factor [Polistes fuscatus]
MFSFHKPKVYRSSTGCCICKAKSSSSRFTDSKKYEEDFIKCFQLEERRTGEICNACVLLVKRWKKLPAGSNRNWRHVVDARAGPGIKSLTKFKSKNKKKLKDSPEKFEKIMKKKNNIYLKPEAEREQNLSMIVDLVENYVPENGSKCFSRTGSPIDRDDIPTVDKSLDIAQEVTNAKDDLSLNGFIDLSYFKREDICCGTIFKGPYGEVIVDPSLIKPCTGCLNNSLSKQRQQQSNVLRNSPAHSSASASPVHSSASASPTHSVESGLDSTVTKQTSKYSDSSSDSGYDESSNQGVGEGKITKVIMNVNPNLKPIVKTQPIKSVQLKAIPVVSESVRLKSDVPIKLVPIKQIDQLSCKPLSLVSSTNVTLSGTSHTIVTVPANPLVDFAMHATPSRQSVSN